MKKFLVFQLIFLTFVIQNCFMLNKNYLQNKWDEFKRKFKKTYANTTDEKLHKLAFFENIQEIFEHNEKYKRGDVTYEKGINQFSDMLEDESEEFSEVEFVNENFQMAVTLIEENIVMESYSIPSSVNWLEEGYETDIPNQGNCSSCYIFPVLGAIEAHYFIKYGVNIKLSVEHVFACSTAYGNKGCKGGSITNVFQMAKNEGIELDNYDDDWNEKECKKNEITRIKIMNFHGVKQGNEQDLRKIVAKYGPVAVSIYMTKSLRQYQGGVYYDENHNVKGFNHALLVIGYGTTRKGEDYWLVRNSWGSYWGEKGYVRLARNKGNICGIANSAFYPSGITKAYPSR